MAFTAVAGLLWGAHGMLAAGVGAALACLNFRRSPALAAAPSVASKAGGGGAGQGLALAAGLLLKMTALFALVWVAVRVLKLQVLPFALGLSVFVISILLVGLGTRPSGNEAEA